MAAYDTNAGSESDSESVGEASDFVYNLDGTGGLRCQCTNLANKTWLNHWSNISGEDYNKCRAFRCASMAQVGAHVREEGGDRRIRWIVPFCQYHNKRPSAHPIQLKSGTTLVRAARSQCE